MKKVLCICFALAIVVAMISCQKECVCKKDVSYLENPDTTTVVVDTTNTDSTATTVTTDNSATMDSIMLNAHHIYDKRECEYLNISDTNVYEVTTLTCSMMKKEK